MTFFVTRNDRGAPRTPVAFVLQIADPVKRTSLNLDLEGPIVKSSEASKYAQPIAYRRLQRYSMLRSSFQFFSFDFVNTK